MKDVNLATCDVCQRVYGKLGQQHAGLHPNVWREDVCTQAIMFAGGNTFPDGGTHILGNVFRGEHISCYTGLHDLVQYFLYFGGQSKQTKDNLLNTFTIDL